MKVTSHPALHIVTTKRMECDARPGIICAAHAAEGSAGMFSVHVCVECTRSPLGSRAMIGTVAGVMFVVGASVVRK